MDFIAKYSGILIFAASQTITVALFILRMYLRIHNLEKELKLTKVQVDTLRDSMKCDNEEMKEQLKEINISLSAMREKFAEMVGVLRGTGHDVSSMR